MKKGYIPILLLPLIPIIFVFKNWVVSPIITGGDFWYYFPSMYSVFHFSYAWVVQSQNGLGGMGNIYQPTNFAFFVPVFIWSTFFHLPWIITERLGFFIPYLLLGIIAPWTLYKVIFDDKKLGILSSFLFLFSSYSLLLASGGQILIAVSCALAFLIVAVFIKLYLVSSKSLGRLNVFLGFLLGLIFVLDLRIAYVAVVSISVLLLVIILTEVLTNRKVSWVSILVSFVFPLAIAFLLNSFWLLPTILLRQNPLNQLGPAYLSDAAVKFFSFANFENALGLMHPNWPENLFGKVGFMRPEFFVYPLLAFGSLLFISSNPKDKKSIFVIALSLVGLVGIFLGKGTNDPFGNVYLWLFHHLPGFTLFRDSTKWYVLTLISYAILIPFTLQNIILVLPRRNKVLLSGVVIIVIFFLILPVRQAFLGQLGGTFSKHTLPADYVKLENMIASKNNFSRTFWVPTLERFGYYSDQHPAIGAENYFQGSVSAMLAKLNTIQAEKSLQEASVKYIIVPDDSTKDVFIADRKYSEKLYQTTVSSLNKIFWLNEIQGFGRIHVFQVPNPKDHFWLTGGGSISYKFIDPTHYIVNLIGVSKGEALVFSETYDKYWQANLANSREQIANSKTYDKRFNSFVLPESGNYSLDVVYTPQKWVNIGLWISGIMFILVCLALSLSLRKTSTCYSY